MNSIDLFCVSVSECAERWTWLTFLMCLLQIRQASLASREGDTPTLYIFSLVCRPSCVQMFCNICWKKCWLWQFYCWLHWWSTWFMREYGQGMRTCSCSLFYLQDSYIEVHMHTHKQKCFDDYSILHLKLYLKHTLLKFVTLISP